MLAVVSASAHLQVNLFICCLIAGKQYCLTPRLYAPRHVLRQVRRGGADPKRAGGDELAGAREETTSGGLTNVYAPADAVSFEGEERMFRVLLLLLLLFFLFFLLSTPKQQQASVENGGRQRQ